MSGSKDRRSRLNAVGPGRRTAGPAVARGAPLDRVRMEQGIRLFLEGIGPSVPRSVLERTPRLVAEAWSRELVSGYRDEGEPLVTPLAEPAPAGLVVVRGLRFVSICRHHLLPFHGTAAVGYLPGKRLAGFSSVARLVDRLARRLQIQEELSRDIARRLEASLDPLGVACLLEARHQCMTCRGAGQPDSRVATLAYRGVFETDPLRRQEVLALLRGDPSAAEGEG